MADAFRGLTIRIGADARPVKSALDNISRSAGQTQKQLNKMAKALRFDGSNTGALKQAMALAGDKAQHMAMSMRTAKTAMEQAASQSAKFGEHSKYAGQTIEQAARSIRNVNATIQQTREQAKTVNGQLQGIYDSAKKIVESRLHAPFATAEQKAKLADDVIKQIQRDLTSTGAKADSAFDAMNKFIAKATSNERMNLAEKFGLGKTEADAQKLYESFVRLHNKSGELNQDLKALKNVAGFQALKTEVLAYESSLRESVSETNRLKAELAAISAPGLARAVSEIKTIGTATQAATEQARVMDAAYAAMPRSIEAARAKITATRNAQQSLREQADALRAAMAKLEQSDGFDKMAASTRNVHQEFARAKNEADEMRVAVEKAQQKVEALNHQSLGEHMDEGDLKRMVADIEKAEKELDQLRQKSIAADEALDRAAQNRHYADLATDLARVNAEMAELHARSSVLNSFKNFGTGLRELGYGLYSTVTPALMMAGRYAIQSAEDIDSAYRDMRKTVNGTEEQFEHLKQAAMDYSTTHVTSADQILEIEAMGGQLGLASTSLEAFATTISNLDIATNINADEAAEQLGKMASVLGISADKYDNFGDALVRLGNNMPVMESDIMTLMTRFMGMGRVVGMSADEMLGWSAAASATGQKSEAAGSSMQRFISKIETAVTAGGEDLEKFASIAGMSADEFAEKFRGNASGAMRDFIAGLGDMQRNGESVNQALMELGVNNVRDKQLLEGLAVQMANAADGASVLDQALKMSSDAYKGMETVMADGSVEKAGDAAREAAKKAEGFSGAIQLLRNQAQVLGSTLAEAAAPMIRDLSVMFGDLTDQMRSMPDSAKTAAVGMLALVAAVGPVSVAAGTITTAVAKVVSVFLGIGGVVTNAAAKIAEAGSFLTWYGKTAEGVAGKTTKASKAASMLGAAFSAIGTPVGLLAVGGAVTMIAGSIGYVVKGVADAQARIETFNAATDGLRQAAQNANYDILNASGSFDTFGQKVLGAEYTLDKMPGVVERAAQAQADLATKMNERSDAARAEIGQLNVAEQALSQYMNKTGLTAAEQGKLRAAIELLNSTYGTQYSVVDAANGKIADEKGALIDTMGAISQFIEEKKRQIQLESLAASYQEAEAQRLERMKELMGQQANIDWLKQQRDQFAENSEGWNEYNGYIEEAITYYGQLKDMYNADADAADHLAQRMGLIQKQSSGVKLTVGESAKASAEWGMAIDAYSANMDEFAAALDRAGANQQEFSKLGVEEMMKLVSAWQTGGMSMEDALASVGVSTRSMGQQLEESLNSAGGNVDELKNRVSELNLEGGMDEFAQKLLDAGINAQQFAEMGIAGFDNLWNAAGQDFANIQETIALLNGTPIDQKTMVVSDDGTIEDVHGNLWTLDRDAKTITSNGVTFQLKEDGSVERVSGELESLNGYTAEGTVTVTAETEEAQGELNDTTDAAESIPEEETVNTSAPGADEAAQQLGDVEDAAESIPDSVSVTASLNDYASDGLQDIIDKMNWLANNSERTVTINEVTNKSENAAGGILATYARGAILRNSIPKNATGALNGIVTRATLTNIGWVGEDGAEAVMHMRNAGGAVVPLTNRRYVRPFARAVASEMGGGQGRAVNVTVQLNYEAGDDANKMAREFAGRLETILSMGA